MVTLYQHAKTAYRKLPLLPSANLRLLIQHYPRVIMTTATI